MDETLLKIVSSQLNLPEEKVEKIVHNWVMLQGKSPQDLDLEGFKEVLINLLQETFKEVSAGDHSFIQLSR